MAFWSVRATAPSADVVEQGDGAAQFDLEPVALFGAGRVTEGWIDPLGHRMTELLNEHRNLRITTDEDDPSAWQTYELEQLVAVAPPPHPPNPAQRVSRRRHRIVLHAAPYRILGTAHLPPGADVKAFLARSPQRWLPLTDCILTAEDGELEVEVEVAIVNVGHVSSVERLLYAL